MLVLIRRAVTWRSRVHQASCHFCSGASSQNLPEHASSSQLQDASSAMFCTTTKELAMKLKATHQKLHSDFKRGKEFEEIWSEHICNTTDLYKYAAAMYSMAQQWEEMDTPLKERNTWIEAEIRHYYFRRRNLVLLQDEIRRAKLDPTLLTLPEEELFRGLQQSLHACWKKQLCEDLRNSNASCGGRGSPSEASEVGCEEKRAAAARPAEALVFSEDSGGTGQLHSTSRVRVLDVGSCYNPLGRYPHLHVTPIDLMPVTQDVYKCDFLSVEVVDASEACDLQHEGDQDPRGGRQIERLPRNYYDVVVFSLVLDYIPCPEARLRCCIKAYQLLRPGGLLLIIMPARCSGNNRLLLKYSQLHLTRLGYGRLNKHNKGNYRTFSYRKGFFQSLWSVVEAKKVEADIRAQRNLQKAGSNCEDKTNEFNLDNLGKGLYFAMDVEPETG